MLTLRWLSPPELPAREGRLLEILGRAPGAYTLDWIYRRVFAHELDAFAVDSEESEIGLVLLAADREQARPTLYLFGVSLGRGVPQGGTRPSAACRQAREIHHVRDLKIPLRSFAQALGCEVIQGIAGPSRRGWRRYAKPVATIYEMEV